MHWNWLSTGEHAFFRGLLRDASHFREADGTPWPKGSRYEIVDGQEEWGVVWRLDPDGTSSFHGFDSDDETWPLEHGSLLRQFEAFMEGGFVGSLGLPNRPYAVGGPVDADLIERMAASVAPRITCDVEVMENRPLDWEEYPAARLGTETWDRELTRDVMRRLAEIYDLPGLEELPWLERGRKLAEATRGKITRDVWAATNKVCHYKKGTKKLYDAWRLPTEGEPQSLIMLRVKRRPPELDYGLHCLGAPWTGPRIVVDLPGFGAPPSFDLDVVRFIAKRPEPLFQVFYEAGDAKFDPEDREPAEATIAVTAPTAWVEGIRPGKYENPAMT